MSEFDQKYNIVDLSTPLNKPLTAHYKKSFAFYTIKERLPVILTQIVDQLSRERDTILAKYGIVAKDIIKDVQGNISKLKYELQTDKPLILLEDDIPDQENWNIFLANLSPETKSYFTTVWLIAECYMYRKLKSIFVQSSTLANYDYFRIQKMNALTTSYNAIISAIEHSNKIQQSVTNQDQLNSLLTKIIKLDLWGNRCDLSISNGREVKQSDDPFAALESFDSNLLVDRIESILKCLNGGNENITIDIVQDNSGYELFTDLLLAKIIIEQKLAGKIRFHIKSIPWFISDVMEFDFHWTIETMAKHENITLRSFGETISELLKVDKFELCSTEYFWTGPYEYDTMKIINPNLYDKLSQAHLIIFKGDLNYRKLLGDFNWPFNTSFETTLRSFRPSNICALRTVKADLICELENGIADDLYKIDPMWMETGQYGVIHFAPKLK